jgi:hypothetical protein
MQNGRDKKNQKVLRYNQKKYSQQHIIRRGTGNTAPLSCGDHIPR